MNLGLLSGLVHGGATAVIVLLVLASVLTLAVIVERTAFLVQERKNLAAVKERMSPLLAQSDLEKATAVLPSLLGVSGKILAGGFDRPGASPEAVEERLTAARLEGKYVLERRLWVLGSLGNNAPFVGLFGTVLGVIKAFSDLANMAGAGPEVVMAGLSEALIATAVGLLVAIPAVMAFNYFMKRSGEYLTETDILSRRLMALLKDARR